MTTRVVVMTFSSRFYHRFPGHRWTRLNYAEVKPGDPRLAQD
jgi:hypothetical protein